MIFVITKNATFRSLIDSFSYAIVSLLSCIVAISGTKSFSVSITSLTVPIVVLRLLEEYIREDAQESLSF